VKKKNNKLIPVAHIDSDFQYYKKEKELSKLSYQLAKIGIYLQSSDQKLNILAIPFTHLLSRLLATLRLNKLLLIFLKCSSFLFSFEVFRSLFRIKIESGDIVIFDCLLIHASDVGISDEKKFVIYSEVGSSVSMINFQSNNVAPRATLEKSDPNMSQIFLRDPNRYSIQQDLYEGGINSFKGVSRNLRMK
jgi:ectoine hydroxylase-related dioxygenase (phytanoyl-CoA dioxygenase family)